jgi:NTP pyrophosphatase (non-canonical NTP hydrolase)
MHPHDLSFAELRAANLARNERWHPGKDGRGKGVDGWSLSDWICAVTGELGEAANIAKKLNRVRDGLAGNTQSEAELRGGFADELADVAIYLDLLAASQGVDLGAAIAAKFNATSARVGFPERLREIGRERSEAEAPCEACAHCGIDGPDGEFYCGLPRPGFPLGVNLTSRARELGCHGRWFEQHPGRTAQGALKPDSGDGQ